MDVDVAAECNFFNVCDLTLSYLFVEENPVAVYGEPVPCASQGLTVDSLSMLSLARKFRYSKLFQKNKTNSSAVLQNVPN